MQTSVLSNVNKTNASKKKAARDERRRAKTGASPTLSRGTGSRTPSSPLVPTNLALSTSADKSSSKEALSGSLKCTPHYTSTASMAEKIGSLVSTDFRYSDKQEEKLISQFDTFFGMLGWTNEDNMADSADAPFPRPEALGANPDAVSMISPGIIIYLQAISAFVKTVIVDNLYISSSTTYDQLAEYNFVH